MTSSSPLPLDPETPEAHLDDAGGPRRPQSLEELFGGKRGVVDSSLPPIAFIAVNAWRGLDAAIWTAVAIGVVLLLARVLRREPVRHTVSGFLGVLIAAAFARRTGSARGFFGPGIVLNAVYALVFLGSVAARRPLIGLLYRSFQTHPAAWFDQPVVRRTYAQVTLLWGGLFLSRVVVQSAFYRADRVGWLAVTKLVMGWPLTLAVLAASVAWIRRQTGHLQPDLPEIELGEPSER